MPGSNHVFQKTNESSQFRCRPAGLEQISRHAYGYAFLAGVAWGYAVLAVCRTNPVCSVITTLQRSSHPSTKTNAKTDPGLKCVHQRFATSANVGRPPSPSMVHVVFFGGVLLCYHHRISPTLTDDSPTTLRRAVCYLAQGLSPRRFYQPSFSIHQHLHLPHIFTSHISSSFNHLHSTFVYTVHHLRSTIHLHNPSSVYTVHHQHTPPQSSFFFNIYIYTY